MTMGFHVRQPADNELQRISVSIFYETPTGTWPILPPPIEEGASP